MKISFDDFFQGQADDFLCAAINQALLEDGPDPAAASLFAPTDLMEARLIAKERTIIAGLPIIPITFRQMECCGAIVAFGVNEGEVAEAGVNVANIIAPAMSMLRAERIFLNFICHLSGIANLTNQYVRAMGDAPTKLLDTRKTLPGLRYPEKYAVLLGGGHNHRFNMQEMIILKDNYIDAVGNITDAVAKLRSKLGDDCPDIEIECRTLKEVQEAVECGPRRIMLDNMPIGILTDALKIIPDRIESEVSGGVTLENISSIAALCPDFISAGAITHSSRYADLSLQLTLAEQY